MIKEKQFDELCELAIQQIGVDIRLKKCRKKEYVQVKCAVINVMRKYQSTTTVALARMMGTHHTTIIHYTQDHPSRYRWDSEYAILYDNMVRHVMNGAMNFNLDQMLQLMKSSLSVPDNKKINIL